MITKSKSVSRVLTRDRLTDDFTGQAEMLGLNMEVFSDGPLNAEIAIVGEGPGEVELRHPQRLPFVGGAGKILWESANKYGMHRHSVYLSNVVKRQISLSTKGNEKHQVGREELDKWIGLVQWELSQLPNVRVILCMGNYALEALTGQTGILKWRGSVLPSTLPNGTEGYVVATVNPAYVTPGRALELEPFFRSDVNRVSQVRDGKFTPYHINHIINPTFKEAVAYIRDLKKSPKPIAYDIEWINLQTACHGLSNNPHEAICINLRDGIQNRFSVSQEADILLAVQDLCDSHRVVAQNGSFDSYSTAMRDHLRIRIWFDILLAHHTLYPRLPHNLGFLCSQYTNHPFYKDDGKDWKEGGDIDEYWKYNCKDSAIAIAIMEKETRELQGEGLIDFFFNHVMRAQPHLVDATIHGVATDMSVKEMLKQDIGEDVAKKLADFHRIAQELTGDEDYWPNPRSTPQMRDLFFNRLKLRGKGHSTDETNRMHIMKDPSTKPLAKELIVAHGAYKTEDKFLGTYANSRVSEDGRFRCEYKQFGVKNAPGRLSSAQLLDGDGGNMQNQPIKARYMYVADDGAVFVYFDLSQAEAQVVSFRADIPKWRQQYAQAKKDGKYDSHRALASEMFGVEYELVPTADWDADGQPTIRYVAKRCRHGLNYRMERERLAEVTELPFHQASRAFVLYHQITPELRRWWAEEERLFRRDKTIYNALGRRFKVYQRLDNNVLDSIIAYYPQSTIGDKITQVWYQCEEDDKWPDKMYARVAIDVHDNLVAITIPKYAKTCMSIMKKYAESPIYIQDVYKKRPPEPLSIPAELKMSIPTRWDGDAKLDWEGKKVKVPGAFVVDQKNGLHRWATMQKVKL